MTTITIRRLRYTDQGTFGVMRINSDGKDTMLCTGELPWRGNAKGKSCIPSGKYAAILEWSPKFGRGLFELHGVPGRAEVKIHKGNYCGDKSMRYKSDVEGCILVGMTHGVIAGQSAVLNSAAALEALHKACGTDTEALVVVEGDARREV
jgi:hypothetical protein